MKSCERSHSKVAEICTWLKFSQSGVFVGWKHCKDDSDANYPICYCRVFTRAHWIHRSYCRLSPENLCCDPSIGAYYSLLLLKNLGRALFLRKAYYILWDANADNNCSRLSGTRSDIVSFVPARTRPLVARGLHMNPNHSCLVRRSVWAYYAMCNGISRSNEMSLAIVSVCSPFL